MESTDPSAGSHIPQLPPGFRFHPTDEELVVHYLKKKVASAPLPVAIIGEIDLYKFDPWELPAKAAFGEQEWYFFSSRERKYPNGARPNRAANSGYWKATGTDKPVMTCGGTQKIGVKKALVFYGGKPPKGIKTNWIMHEYRLTDEKTVSEPHGSDPTKQKGSLWLDDLVLCRIYKKTDMQRPVDSEGSDYQNMNGKLASIPSSISLVGGHHTMVDNQQHNISNLLPVKRSLSDLFWTEEAAAAHPGNSSSAASSVLGTRTTEETSGSIASMFSQLPHTPQLQQQTPQLQQQTMLGSLEDGVFRPPYQLLAGMNWYS